MDSLAQPAVVAVACAALVCAGAVLLGLRARGMARTRRAQLDAELARSRTDVDRLARRVEELTHEVVEARRSAAEVAAHGLDREYVITSLAELGEDGSGASGRLSSDLARPSLGVLAEERLVDALARRQGGSAAKDRAVALVVRTVALGHGVRRALSADVLDRAAAEANVARRRSRRARRREVREARRLIRAVRSHQGQQRDEDAA